MDETHTGRAHGALDLFRLMADNDKNLFRWRALQRGVNHMQ